MRLADSHLHLHDERMIAQADEAVARAREANVGLFVLAGVDSAGWQVEAELARRHPDVKVTYGLHPQLLPHLTDAQVDEQLGALERVIRTKSLPAAVAVGEIGLDAYSDENRATLDRQERAFVEQLKLAKRFDLPVCLHILAAHAKAIEILKREGTPPAGGVVHSYSGSAELVKDYVKLNLCISFAGTVTRPSAKRARAACTATPSDRLLIETDSPDQTPDIRRPARNEPAFLVDIAQAAAELRGATLEEVAELTYLNTERLFRLA